MDNFNDILFLYDKTTIIIGGGRLDYPIIRAKMDKGADIDASAEERVTDLVKRL